MKILKTLLNPLRTAGMLLMLLFFSKSFAQNQEPKMTLDKIMETTFNVKDFDVWKPLFIKDSIFRKQNGVQNIIISSKIGNPRHMMNVAIIEDVEKARASMKDPAFLKRIRTRGVSNPKAEFYQVVRYNSDAKENQWVIMTHKVKNFDTWIVAFDEGKPMRSAAGLIDAVIARNIDDPSIVQVVCDITSLKKAQVFVASEKLKEKMKDAGVIGKPHIEYYEIK